MNYAEQEAAGERGLRIELQGVIQGIGMRPFIYRLAQDMSLCGAVSNLNGTLLIDIWATPQCSELFVQRLRDGIPSGGRIDAIAYLQPQNDKPQSFSIVSVSGPAPLTHSVGIVADRASCAACRSELFQPKDRRYHYPFNSCTDCGPRYSILRRGPWERCNSSLATFSLCPKCDSEYCSSADRRFHAQPINCPDCGPSLYLHSDNKDGNISDIEQAAAIIRRGGLLAIQGVGCVHLACDARQTSAIRRLRKLKQRPAKPLALLASHTEMIARYCAISPGEQALLNSPEAPIVLLQKVSSALPNELAPGLTKLGLMVAHTPLQHLLMAELTSPIVLTSANLSASAPICNARDHLDVLATMADGTLFHDCHVLHRVEDSVAQVVAGQTQLLRRSRGYVPQSTPLPDGFSRSKATLALGSHGKNSFCLLQKGQAVLSPWIGDLNSASQRENYLQEISDFSELHHFTAQYLACDAHPEYFSSVTAEKLSQGKPAAVSHIWHHHAHAASCLADNQRPLNSPAILAVIFDGSGLGPDGTIWGGEFLLCNYQQFHRIAHLQTSTLPGGEQAIQQPWRSLWAQLSSSIGWSQAMAQYSQLTPLIKLQNKPLTTLQAMAENSINSPTTSSVGRLFDGVAAAVDICFDAISYDGEAAIKLQALAEQSIDTQAYTIDIQDDSDDATQIPTLSYATMWRQLLNDIQADVPKADIARRFHLGLATAVARTADHLFTHCHDWQEKTIVLSGGVFQNKLLLESTKEQLEQFGFSVLIHRDIPANDSGLALGQALVCAANKLVAKEKIHLCV